MNWDNFLNGLIVAALMLLALSGPPREPVSAATPCPAEHETCLS